MDCFHFYVSCGRTRSRFFLDGRPLSATRPFAIPDNLQSQTRFVDRDLDTSLYPMHCSGFPLDTVPSRNGARSARGVVIPRRSTRPDH